jgi:hypothetical protein
VDGGAVGGAQDGTELRPGKAISYLLNHRSKKADAQFIDVGTFVADTGTDAGEAEHYVDS